MFELLLVKKSSALSGSGNFGLFVGGYGTTTLGSTEKYFYANGAVAAGSVLPEATNLPTGAGNSTTGLILGGATASAAYSTQSVLYTYANNSMAYGRALSPGRREFGGGAGETFGIFASGGTASTTLYTSFRWIFSSSTYVAGTNMPVSKYMPGVISNLEIAVFAGGSSISNYSTYNTKTSHTYNYSANIWAAGANISANKSMLAAAGTGTMGVFAGGGNNTTADGGTAVSEVYSYSSASFSIGTSLGVARIRLAGTGDNEAGIFSGGGYSSATSYTDRYEYLTHSRTSGTSLITARRTHAAVSSSPGWVIPA